jgi:REP element-mobilizing transposase RayT
LAWVVMPDHLHWLVRLETLSLSALMRNVKGRSARRLNQHLDLTGPFWQAGFHDRALREEEDLRLMARYIVANPIRAGLVERVGDYPLWDAIWL